MTDITWAQVGIKPDNILLPSRKVELPFWAVVACDQYSSQPEYWQQVADFVGDRPSSFHMILPEAFLSEAETRLPMINQTMADYLENGIVVPSVRDGFVLTQRTTQSGERIGLVVAADLEAYDYAQEANSLIRATEGTILSRIPPRVKIRKDASLECPHAVLLMDDTLQSVVEPIYAGRDELPVLYDFPLMMGGGGLKGWAVTAPSLKAQVYRALEALGQKGGPLFCVGDGNHSLAAAKALWEEIKATLPPDAKAHHPARYALVEIENIHCPALSFEPIHRLLTGVNGDELMAQWAQYCLNHGMALREGPAKPGEHPFKALYQGRELQVAVAQPQAPLPVGTLQNFLDDYLQDHPQAQLDYIHGEEALRRLAVQPGAVGFEVPGMQKGDLFAAVAGHGALPRKTFSMGEAHEKRYYMECRWIRS